MSKTSRIPVRNTTLPKVAQGVNDLHDCLEEARADITDLKGDMRHLRKTVDSIASGFGMPTSAMISQGAQPSAPARVKAKWDVATIATIVGATGGGLMLFKVVAAVVPVAWQAILSIS